MVPTIFLLLVQFLYVFIVNITKFVTVEQHLNCNYSDLLQLFTLFMCGNEKVFISSRTSIRLARQKDIEIFVSFKKRDSIRKNRSFYKGFKCFILNINVK